MELKLNVTNEWDIISLFRILRNQKDNYENSNYEHQDLINLLEGNVTNERAMRRLDSEKHIVRINKERIQCINNLLKQLEPLVQQYLNN